MLQFSTVFFSLVTVSFAIPEKSIVEDFIQKFHQHDYEIKYERVELIAYDKDYMDNVSVITFKYNRTCTAFNITLGFKKDVDSTLQLEVQGYKFASNEYRLFPMRFQLDYCDALAKNVFGMSRDTLSKCEKFTPCPFIKGKTYNICKFVPDASQFPPYIPTGKYKGVARMFYKSMEMFAVDGYLEILRPFVGK